MINSLFLGQGEINNEAVKKSIDFVTFVKKLHKKVRIKNNIFSKIREFC